MEDRHGHSEQEVCGAVESGGTRDADEAGAWGKAAARKITRARMWLKVGAAGVDGTYIRANASKEKIVRLDRAGEWDQQLQRDNPDPLEQAEQTDRREDIDGLSLPKEIARRECLRDEMQPGVVATFRHAGS